MPCNTVTHPLASTVATEVSLLEYKTALPSEREVVAVKLNDKSGIYVLEMLPPTYASLARVIVVAARFTVTALLSIVELAYLSVSAWVALNVTVPLPTSVIAPVDSLMIATLETSVVVEYVIAPAGL